MMKAVMNEIFFVGVTIYFFMVFERSRRIINIVIRKGDDFIDINRWV